MLDLCNVSEHVSHAIWRDNGQLFADVHATMRLIVRHKDQMQVHVPFTPSVWIWVPDLNMTCPINLAGFVLMNEILHVCDRIARDPKMWLRNALLGLCQVLAQLPWLCQSLRQPFSPNYGFLGLLSHRRNVPSFASILMRATWISKADCPGTLEMNIKHSRHWL